MGKKLWVGITVLIIVVIAVVLLQNKGFVQVTTRPPSSSSQNPYCGDGTCNDNETCSSCFADCGNCHESPPNAHYCGDGTCDSNETCSICPSDCGVCSASDSLIHPEPPSYTLTSQEKPKIAGDPAPSTGKSGCFSNDDCSDGNDQTFDYCQNPSTSKSKCLHTPFTCVDLLVQGTESDKLDVTFVSEGFKTEDDLKLLDAGISNQISELLRREPFYSNYKKINFHLVRGTFDFGFTSDNPDIPLSPDDASPKSVVSRCFKTDETVLMLNSATTSEVFGGIGNHFAIGELANPATTVHEFGHSFGGLLDEYLTMFLHDGVPNDNTFMPLDKNIPNIDNVAGCPKWCSGKPIPYQNECTKITDETECRHHSRTFSTVFNKWSCDILDPTKCCVWLPQPHPFFKSQCVSAQDNVNVGAECIPGGGCYEGADNSQTYWRSVPTSIMLAIDKTSPYCPPCVQHMEKLLSKYR